MPKEITKSITVKNLPINIKTEKANDEFICLTDMAKFKGNETGIIIANWLTTKFTIQFLGLWEEMHNPNFNLMEFHKIKNEVGTQLVGICNADLCLLKISIVKNLKF